MKRFIFALLTLAMSTVAASVTNAIWDRAAAATAAYWSAYVSGLDRCTP